jgi:uncharacterized membrane protein
MGWRILSIVFVLAGILAMPAWPYSQNWSIFAPAFCWFVAILFFLVSIFARHGSAVWRHRGHG